MAMSEGWNLNQLREHIEGLGDKKEDLLTLVASLDRNNLIYQYHLYTARDAMKGIIKEGENSEWQNSQFVFGAAENQEEYNLAKIADEANLFGAIYATRATLDILSQLINGLVLGEEFTIATCGIHKVENALPDCTLKAELGNLLTHSWFIYISDIVNTIKHRRLMPHRFVVNFDKPGSGIYVEGFEYGERTYPQYTDAEILKGTLQVNCSIIDCGKALNELVLSNEQQPRKKSNG